MRLIYYGVSADEEKFIKRWSFSNKIPVTIINEGISSENVHFAGPHDGVCLYPSPEMRQSELLYRKLREQGIPNLFLGSIPFTDLSNTLRASFFLSSSAVINF